MPFGMDYTAIEVFIDSFLEIRKRNYKIAKI